MLWTHQYWPFMSVVIPSQCEAYCNQFVISNKSSCVRNPLPRGLCWKPRGWLTCTASSLQWDQTIERITKALPKTMSKTNLEPIPRNSPLVFLPHHHQQELNQVVDTVHKWPNLWPNQVMTSFVYPTSHELQYGQYAWMVPDADPTQPTTIKIW